MKRKEMEVVDDTRKIRPEAVQRLYDVFCSYRLRERVTGCFWFIDDEAIDFHGAKPLETLDSGILYGYLWSAISDWGTEANFKHFLPRILELVLAGEIEVSLVTQKLNSAKWREWPTNESEAVHEFFLYAWRQDLETKTTGELTVWSETLTTLGEPFEDYLFEWLNGSSLAVRLHFAEWVVAGGWQDWPVADSAELFTETTVEELEANFFEDPEGVYAPTFAAAADIARNMMIWSEREL